MGTAFYVTLFNRLHRENNPLAQEAYKLAMMPEHQRVAYLMERAGLAEKLLEA